MPETMESPHHTKQTLAAKLKPINGLPIIIDAYHLRFLLIGFSKTNQAALFSEWLNYDRRQHFFNSLKPYKRAKLTHSELQTIATSLLAQLQHFMLDMPDPIIVEQLKEIIHTTCRWNSYRAYLKTILLYQQQVNAILKSYDTSHQLIRPIQPWLEIESYIYSQRLWYEHFFDFFRYKIVPLAIVASPIASFYYDLYDNTEQAIPRLMKHLDNFIASSENATYLLLYGLTLTISAMAFALEDRIPLSKIQSELIEPLFLQGLLCHAQKNINHDNAYADLISLFPLPLAGIAPLFDEPDVRKSVTPNDRCILHVNDIDDKARNNHYFFLNAKQYVRFNRLDWVRLHPFKKGNSAEQAIQSFYDAVNSERKLTDVTLKEKKNHHSCFFGLDAKLKPLDSFQSARLAFKLRAPSHEEQDLGITAEVYSPQIITAHNRRSY